MHGQQNIKKPLNKLPGHQKDTTHTQETNIQVQTRDPGFETASDICLRPQGHRDQPLSYYSS